ncbi:MAG: YbaB/EbfC family nucleoid-associated protein [Negativicoccus massiliensis]|uniref:YbaB/EbfC family nucleoid-associated protein n=1 Tax=Negativicoccus succinicivorans TaxID=620903 RepID=UPI0026EDD5F3|nr:YbaB/EbfC family nucleoid-associated protein [Negativicoccus succinicivorans]MDU4641386.1 YbaB/EbfC family nucleoid-associated protein [Negativicoccus massiliensis]MBS5887829.1 YbaB/EbfC family nucleoid-associated protein [Negativicoccus succinicivorans]MBS6028572.1 YbaB/EbfC family nucleoid-associated protein [Negativicoccus succinicivorans]MDU2417928.1 YbaB/EbfC family nucleoid-associated protein [Negativicoccus succinicivorans]MDU3214316.1 YbaB/EbfC family nucleoid-associated protein [Ne
MFGNKAQMAGMMKKVKKMQDDMAKMQDELKRKTTEVTAGGGAIRLVMNGEKQITELKIDPAVLEAQDAEMLEDLVTAAVNEAGRKIDDMASQEVNRITGGMGLPPGMF